MRILKNKHIEDTLIYYCLLAVFCMNFLGRGSIFCLIFAIYAFLSIIKRSKKIVMDADAVVALLFSAVAFFVSFVHVSALEAIKSLNFFLLYLIGLNGVHLAQNKETYIKKVMFAIFTGYTLLIAMTYFYNLGFAIIDGQRILYNIWTEEMIAATLLGLVSSVVIGYLFYAFWCQKKKLLKIISIVALVFVFLINERSATRTPFVLFVLIMILMWLIYLVNQKGIAVLKKLVVPLLLLLAGAAMYVTDAWGIRTYVESTSIFERFLKEGTETPRGEIMGIYLKYMLDYPWGGSKVYELTGYNAHNFLQQGYDLYGVMAAVPLCILTISFVKNIIVLLGVKRKRDLDYLLISMYLSMTIQSMLEPIFTGYPCFFFTLLLIHGMANGYIRNVNRLQYENCRN